MAGYSKIYVIGSPGGFMGADGVNTIEFMILVGDASRQWLEPKYFDKSIKPIGQINNIVPLGPDHPDSLLDACIAFCPRHFRSCPSLQEVENNLHGIKKMDFDATPEIIPPAWEQLREEARPIFSNMHIWVADLVPFWTKL